MFDSDDLHEMYAADERRKKLEAAKLASGAWLQNAKIPLGYDERDAKGV